MDVLTTIIRLLVRFLRLLLETAAAAAKPGPTYCPMLWENVFITPSGELFSCCAWKPGSFGNINQNSLGEVWESSLRLKIYRLLSLNGCLSCFAKCTILPKGDKLRAPAPPASASHPKKIWLLYGETCNLNCIMCPQEHFSKKTIDNDVIRKNVDWAQVDEIEMQGGEILAMKDAKALYLWLTASLGKKVNTITNGVLIDDEWADHLVKGADWIQISVNAATKLTHELVNRKSSFDRVIANVKKLVAAKQEYALAVRIIFKYTIVAENVHEIADAILFAESIGCDEIHFGYDAKVRDYLEKNPEVMLKLRDDIARQLSRDHKILVEHDRLQHLNLLD